VLGTSAKLLTIRQSLPSLYFRFYAKACLGKRKSDDFPRFTHPLDKNNNQENQKLPAPML
jgi:hypothetical protein